MTGKKKKKRQNYLADILKRIFNGPVNPTLDQKAAKNS